MFYSPEEEMKVYRENKEIFLKEGFTASIARALLNIAMLRVWDAYYLFAHARRIPRRGTYLEIGSRDGGSVMCAYWAARHLGLTFIAIEPNPTKPLLKNTNTIPREHFIGLSDFSYNVKDKIRDNSVDLLFYDANHGYVETKRDIKDYWLKIKSNGLLFCHDYTTPDCPGVKQAIDEIFGGKGTVLENSSIWGIKKK